MSPSRELGRARTDRGEVVLVQRVASDGSDRVELRVNGVFVMDDAETSSEREMARLALSRAPAPRRVLVGGLGLGFTLGAVLADERVERVVVAEIEAPVVGWMHDGTVPHGPALLADPRLQVRVEDVADTVERLPPGSVDLTLLDVDNGPSYLVHDGNADLYRPGFLRSLHGALAEGGVVVVWSMTWEADLVRALEEVFGEVEQVPYAVDLQGRAERYWLFVATRATAQRR